MFLPHVYYDLYDKKTLSKKSGHDKKNMNIRTTSTTPTPMMSTFVNKDKKKKQASTTRAPHKKSTSKASEKGGWDDETIATVPSIGSLSLSTKSRHSSKFSTADASSVISSGTSKSAPMYGSHSSKSSPSGKKASKAASDATVGSEGHSDTIATNWDTLGFGEIDISAELGLDEEQADYDEDSSLAVPGVDDTTINNSSISQPSRPDQWLELQIKELETNQRSVERRIKSMRSFLQSRIASKNTIGALLALKQLKVLELEQSMTSAVLQDYCHLFFQINTTCSDVSFDYLQAQMNDILQHRTKTDPAPENDVQLLEELQQMGLSHGDSSDEEENNK